jgi:hypothetical protein
MPRLPSENGKGTQQRATALPEEVTDDQLHQLVSAVEMLREVDLAQVRSLNPAKEWDAPNGGGHGEVNRMLQAGEPKPDFGYEVPPEESEWTGTLPELEASDEESRPRGDRQLEGEVPG